MRALRTAEVCVCVCCVQKEAASKLADRLRALEARAEQFEAQLDQANCSQADRLKRFETKLGRRMSSVESNLHQEVQLLKQECLKGRRKLSVISK